MHVPSRRLSPAGCHHPPAWARALAPPLRCAAAGLWWRASGPAVCGRCSSSRGNGRVAPAGAAVAVPAAAAAAAAGGKHKEHVCQHTACVNCASWHTSIVEGRQGACSESVAHLPPWLETIIASTPSSTAFRASSGARMPCIRQDVQSGKGDKAKLINSTCPAWPAATQINAYIFIHFGI
jgi:hypothetical protein